MAGDHAGQMREQRHLVEVAAISAAPRKPCRIWL